MCNPPLTQREKRYIVLAIIHADPSLDVTGANIVEKLDLMDELHDLTQWSKNRNTQDTYDNENGRNLT